MKYEGNDEDARRERAYEHLGSREPRCTICQEDDYRTLEQHHIAGKANDDLMVILCSNCHKKQSDPTSNSKALDNRTMVEKAAYFLLGIGAFFALLAERCLIYGHAILEFLRGDDGGPVPVLA